MNLRPPRDELVMQDCDRALDIDKNYVNALSWHGTAVESLRRLLKALGGS